MAELTQPLEETEQFRTDQVMTVVGGHFAHDSFSAFISPLLIPIQAKLGIGYGLAGNLAIFMQLPGLLNPFIGYIADKVSLRYFIIFAPAITATLMSLMGTAPTYLTLVLLLLATGFSIAAFHAPAPAMIGEMSGKYVGRGMSLFMAGGELGRALGPVAVVWAVSRYSLEGIWRLAFVGWAVSLILWWRLREAKARPVVKFNGGVSAEVRERVTRFFSPLALLMFFRTGHIATLTTFLPLYMSNAMQESGFEPSGLLLSLLEFAQVRPSAYTLVLAGASLTLLEFAGVAGALATGTLSDHFGRINVLMLLLLTAPIFTLIFLVLPVATAFPMLILVGVSAIAATPVIMAMVQDQFRDIRAFASGIYMALNFLVRAAGIALIGWSADQYGPQNTFLFASALAFFTLPALWWLRQHFIEQNAN